MEEPFGLLCQLPKNDRCCLTWTELEAKQGERGMMWDESDKLKCEEGMDDKVKVVQHKKEEKIEKGNREKGERGKWQMEKQKLMRLFSSTENSFSILDCVFIKKKKHFTLCFFSFG